MNNSYVIGLLLMVAMGCWSESSNASEVLSIAPPLEEQAEISGAHKYGAQVLHSHRKVNVFKDLNWETIQYYSIRINDQEAARDYGRISIVFNHYYHNMELDFANVRNEKGHVKPLAKDALQHRTVAGQDFYTERTELTFSLPEVVPGSILEFQFRRSSKIQPLHTLFSHRSENYWFQPTVGGNGWRADPVRFSSYTIDNMSERKLHIRQSEPTKVYTSYDFHEQNGHKIHRWEWKKLPHIILEPFMPPIKELVAEVVVSTSTDWKEVDAWAWGLVKGKFASTDQLKKEVNKLALIGASRDEKIRSVYAYLQNKIRYVYAHLGRGGYEPHMAEDVVLQRYGDCKDQTILGIALLRELGIDAYPALVVTPRSGMPDMSLVSLVFDHMIIWIPPENNNSRAMWMDSTSDKGLFPGLSSYLQGQPALIVNGKGGVLKNIAMTDVPVNVANLDLNYVEKSKQVLEVTAVIHLSGIFEENIRNWWIRDNNREDTLQKLVKDIFSQAGGNVKIKAEVLNNESLWDPVKIKAVFKFPKVKKDQSIVHETSITQLYRLFGGFSSLPQPKGRVHQFVDELTYKLRIQSKFTGFKDSVPLVINSGSDKTTSFFMLTQSGRVDGRQYYTDIVFERGPLNLRRKDYAKYYEAISKLGVDNSWLLTFNHDSKEKKLAELKENKNESDSLETKLELTRYYLEQGEFQEAIDLAKIIVLDHKDSGEAWYVLGTAQGFNALFDASAESFERATELGYQP